MRALAKGLIENGGLILTKNPLTDVKKIGDNIIVITPKEDLNVNDWYSGWFSKCKIGTKNRTQTIHPTSKGQIIITEKLDQKFIFQHY